MQIDDTVRLLVRNAALQFLFSTVVGWLMLLPMQPWGRGLRARVKNVHALTAAHVDWYLLALMQIAAAFGWLIMPLPQWRWIGWLLVLGGWLNPVPYLLRGLTNINAFSFSGPPIQRLCAAVAGVSSAAILVAWTALVVGWMT